MVYFSSMLITPENKKKLARFKEIKRGYYSLIVILILIVFSLFAEFFINNKALIVSYQGEYYFPVLGKFYSGETFGLDYSYEADYKEPKKTPIIVERIYKASEKKIAMRKP